MSRAFCIPGIIFLFCALVLNFLVSISLPFLPALDIARTHFGTGGSVSQGALGITELRLGIWAPCAYDTKGDRTCAKSGRAYTVQITNLDGTKVATVKASWTRGLAVHPVGEPLMNLMISETQVKPCIISATAVTFIAFLLSFSSHITVTLIASMVSFLAALLTLIAFAIDIALFALVDHAMKGLGIGANTNTAPGFWMTFVAFILLLLAGCTVCFGRRRDRLSNATSNYPMQTSPSGRLWARLRGNKV
ncbi:hypothetical protein BDZ97DRAFT_328267 [Flammula alnicola]|nr:hypothetical protein BDZ97DRAFT_328267 [Flammula alnicola]